jgi:hypothetical protein
MRRALLAALVLGSASNAFAGAGGAWSISKASGDVWIATDGAQQVSLKQEETLKPGDTIRTGRNGRVLLIRGDETILISPNSVVGLPAEQKDGLSTTIVQQAGSILLEVEKRNVKHFEVETPYLAAVVKGTQFSVTVNAGSTKVGVLRGQVEVSDFRTGQVAQVMPGQAATAFEHGKPGISLSGSGGFNPIEQGKPRASTIERVPVPKSGLSAPRDAANGRTFHALGHVEKGTKAADAASKPHQAAGGSHPKAGVVRISSSLGEVKLNFHKVTHGLAHGSVARGAARSVSSSSTDTVWSDGKATTTASNTATQTAVATSSSTTSSSTSSSSTTTTTAATAAGSSSDSSSSGNSSSGNSGDGNSGNGNSGNGNSGNGNGNSGGATGNGKGNNGNGNGNGVGDGSNGHGHGNAYGHNKH